MKDVAREAGVALGTVSKVMNNIPVGEEYRLKVEAAAKKLGYRVNSYAKGLKTNHTGIVALIIPSVRHPFFGILTDHLCRVLMKRGYRTLLATTESDMEMENKCIRLVQQHKVEGIIALTYNPDIEIDEDIPFVSIDRFYTNRVPCVASDNFGGGQLAAAKLSELGAEKLLFLRIGSSVIGEPDKREAGFKAWCQNHKIPHHVIHLNDEDGFKPFYDFLENHIIEGKPEYDGIFCSTDQLAVNILRVLEQLGLKVPEDVQIIGFDGLLNYIDYKPYCSSIVQPVEKIAETAVEILFNEDRSKLPALTCLPVSYRPGGTTGDRDMEKKKNGEV
ncbi:MAG: LacI family DNA-binding transcriptional regulator [Lachnospiraceae bacterium]|nr:LacI family DNA-binding transcriptional regulator [Lachnospiraceae bacterium]